MPGGEVGEARGPSREGRAGEILRKNRAGEEDWRRSRSPTEARAGRAAAAAAARRRPGERRERPGGGGREKGEGKQIRVRGEWREGRRGERRGGERG